jgi:DHA3 family multidrug efflux protein-like MFS transporter
MALVFSVAGVLGLIATVLAWNSGYYRRLSAAYAKGAEAA